MRPILKVNCYKKSGKWALSNKGEDESFPELSGKFYPTLVDSYGTQLTRGELWGLQTEAAQDLEALIRSNDPSVKFLSPEGIGFNRNYIYHIELIVPDHYQGFCNFILDLSE